MKNIFLLLFCCCLVGMVFAQKPETTRQKVDYTGGDVVMKAFQEHFPKATNVKWGSYEELKMVSFKLVDEQYHAYYNSDGSLRLTAAILTPRQLPGSLAEELSLKYSQYTVDGIYLLYENGHPTYYAELVKEGKKFVLNSTGKKWSLTKRTKLMQ